MFHWNGTIGMFHFLMFTKMSMSYLAEMNGYDHMSRQVNHSLKIFKLVLLKPGSKYPRGMQLCAREYTISLDKPLPRMSMLL